MTNIYHERIISLVQYMAATMVRKYPHADYEDVCQDLWVEIFKVAKKGSYDANRAASLETFLFQHLQWRVQNWVRLAWTRHDLLKEQVYLNLARGVSAEPVEVHPDQLCEQIKRRLRPFEKKVFAQYVDPAPELMQIAMSDADSAGRETTNFNQAHLAHYFGVSQMTISRTMKTIKKTTEAVVGK
jgi:DNA-directed RNA polymerase specialized sigma subunit